jgi:hypothetical protein
MTCRTDPFENDTFTPYKVDGFDRLHRGQVSFAEALEATKA